MPKLITRKVHMQDEPCNFTDLSQNDFVEQHVPLTELKMRCTRYKDYLAALQPPQENIMVRAASFTVDSVLQVIQKNPQAAFIRVYNGIDENGQHLLFMAPVTQTGSTTEEVASFSTTEESTTSTSEEEITVADSCCECPPLRNCQGDELLEENP